MDEQPKSILYTIRLLKHVTTIIYLGHWFYEKFSHKVTEDNCAFKTATQKKHHISAAIFNTQIFLTTSLATFL